MNEASSKFVDKIATEKLLSEKLMPSSHRPDPKWQSIDASLQDLDSLGSQLTDLHREKRNGTTLLTFSSSVQTGYDKNDSVPCTIFPAEQNAGDVIFVHGLYEDNREIYNFFISQLNGTGINVHLLTLPYHYERQPADSAFSGEYYFSGDAFRNSVAFKQAVADVTLYYRHLKAQTGRSVWITGFSMGGGIALTIAGKINVDGIFAINPVCNIAHLIWTSPLFDPVKNDLVDAGLTQQNIAKLYNEFEPLRFTPPATPLGQIALGIGLYDQINDPENYALLQQTWNLQHTMNYKAGHLNILRVPKLAHDIAAYYFGNTK
jgi:alpha-beta hydrolase superfamily lysophospholipase